MKICTFTPSAGDEQFPQNSEKARSFGLSWHLAADLPLVLSGNKTPLKSVCFIHRFFMRNMGRFRLSERQIAVVETARRPMIYRKK